MSGVVLIRNAHLVDPSQNIDQRASILIEDGVICDIDTAGEPGTPDGATLIVADDLHAAPGLIDARVFTGEPGSEHRETIASASAAAAAGGVTGFVMMPQTDPVIDDVALVDFVRREAAENAIVRVHPSAAVTKGLAGSELSEIGLMAGAGAVMISEGRKTLRSSLLVRRAMSYARDFGVRVALETQDPDLAANGVMNEGLTATRLGLPGIPREAETIVLERDLRLAKLSGGLYHAAQVSTSSSVEALGRFKNDSPQITAGVSINHLSLNENDIGRYRTFFRMSPPLRSEDDRQAVIEGLANGTIDIIVSSHDPHDVDTKRLPFAEAAAGGIGLETLLSAALRLHHDGLVPLGRLIDALSCRPAKLFGLTGGTLKKGVAADLVLFDTGYPWIVREQSIRSRSKNTPFEGSRFSGKVMRTMVAGHTVFAHDENAE